MSENKDDTPNSNEPIFVSPERFYYSNAIRTYTTGPEVFLEFSRTLPLGKDGHPTAKGECGVVVSVPVATKLVAQLQDTIQAALKKLNESSQIHAAQTAKANDDGNSSPNT